MSAPGFACLLVLAIGLGGWCAAAEAPPEKVGEVKAKITFAPEVESKLTEFFTKLMEAKRKHAAERIKTQIEEVVKVTGLDADGAKALEKPAWEAAELSGKALVAKSEDLWRKQMNQAPEQMIEVLDQSLSQIEVHAQGGYFGGQADPADYAVWTEALQRILTPEQAAVWNKAQLERKQALVKEFGDVVKRSVERMRERQLQATLAKTADFKIVLGLSEERGQKLDALAKSATEQSAEAWRSRAEKVLLAMPDPQRRLTAKQGNLYLAPDEGEAAERQPAWKDGLAQLLSPEEVKQLDDAREEKKTRQVRVLGQFMLAQFDEKVAFTADQRQQLQPMAERLVRGEPGLFPDSGPDEHIRLGPQTFLGAGQKAARPELEALLDPIQCEHWHEAAHAKMPSRFSGFGVRKAPPETKPEPSEREPEPEHFEHVVSDFFFEKMEAERKRLSGFMILKAEDAARVASLSPEATGRLQTAARGAAKESLAAWRTTTEESLRSNLNEATARNVKQRLEAMEEYQFRRQRSGPAEKRPVWEKTVETEMGEPQRKAWQWEVDERAAYRDRAIASLILTEFDRRNSLTPQQWTTLEPMVVTFLKEYGPDIGTMFSSSDSTPWYLQSYSMFLPFASIPEKDLKGILGKEQWERWTGSSDFSNTASYWENIRSNHEQRKKNAKK